MGDDVGGVLFARWSFSFAELPEFALCHDGQPGLEHIDRIDTEQLAGAGEIAFAHLHDQGDTLKRGTHGSLGFYRAATG